MKVLFLYGAPAVGKLTVANEIAKQTDFKVFHNHLSIDCIKPVFEFGSQPFHKLVEIIRSETLAEAARQNVNVIFTFCYAKDLDDDYVKRTVEIVESNRGQVIFVLLTCESSELEKRICDDSRHKFSKVKTVKTLNELLEKYQLFSPVNDYQSLQIDNTNLNPSETATQIIKYYNLQVPH